MVSGRERIVLLPSDNLTVLRVPHTNVLLYKCISAEGSLSIINIT